MSKKTTHLDLSILFYSMAEFGILPDNKPRPSKLFEEEDCSICLSPIPSAGCVTTSCGHPFCLSCFLKHIDTKNTCPLCRADIRSPDEIPRNGRHVNDWGRLVYHVRMMYSALRDRGGMIRAFYILTSSTSQEDFESQAVNQYRRFMEVRNNRAETEARRREAQQRSLTRRSQDRENGIIVGAKMRLNPNGEPCARRHLRIALDGQEDNKLATIIKVLVVSIDVKFDDYDKVVRFRKDSPHYTLV